MHNKASAENERKHISASKKRKHAVIRSNSHILKGRYRASLRGHPVKGLSQVKQKVIAVPLRNKGLRYLLPISSPSGVIHFNLNIKVWRASRITTGCSSFMPLWPLSMWNSVSLNTHLSFTQIVVAPLKTISRQSKIHDSTLQKICFCALTSIW